MSDNSQRLLGAGVRDELLPAQAAELEDLLPQILRRLFSLAPDSPIADMPLAQLRLCSYLQMGPRAMSAIGEEMGMSVSAVTQIADRMERNGLVERMPGKEDRRSKHLRLTAHGETLMRERRERRTRRALEALALLPASTRDRLIRGLHQLLEATIATAPPIVGEHHDAGRSET